LNLKDKKKDESFHRWSERKQWTHEEVEQLADELVDYMMENDKEIKYNKFLHDHGFFDSKIGYWKARSEYFRNAYEKAENITKERMIYEGYKGRADTRFTLFLLGSRYGLYNIQQHQIGGMKGAPPIQLSNEEMIGQLRTIAKDIFDAKELKEMAGDPKAIEYKNPEECKQELLVEKEKPECEQ